MHSTTQGLKINKQCKQTFHAVWQKRGLGSKPNQLQLINVMHHHNTNILDELVHNSSLFKDEVFTEEQQIHDEGLREVSLLDFALCNDRRFFDSQTKEGRMNSRGRGKARNPGPLGKKTPNEHPRPLHQSLVECRWALRKCVPAPEAWMQRPTSSRRYTGVITWERSAQSV